MSKTIVLSKRMAWGLVGVASVLIIMMAVMYVSLYSRILDTERRSFEAIQGVRANLSELKYELDNASSVRD